MSMKLWWVACLVAGWALSPLAAQEMLTGGDFESGLQGGWEAQVENGARVTTAPDTPAQGKLTALLQTTNGARGWLLSPALAGVKTGDTVLLNFAVRRVHGQCALVLDVVGAPGELSEAVVWEAVLPAGATWRRVSLIMKVPPLAGGVAPRLAWGVMGATGAWALDNVTVTAGPAALPVTAPRPEWGQPWQTSVMEPGWEPGGHLDATVRTIGATPELSVNVNGVTLTSRSEMMSYRGFREAMVMYAVNRGKLDKQIEVQISGPASVDSPWWTLPVKPEGTTRFHIVAQSLQAGECWLKVTFRSGGQEVSLPVKLTSYRAYPTLGVVWRGRVQPERLAELGNLPLTAHLLVAPPDLAALGPMAEAVQAVGGEVLLGPELQSLTAQQYLAAVSHLSDRLQPSFWLPYALTPSAVTAGSVAGVELAATLKAAQAKSGVLLPPLQVRRDWLKGGNRPVETRVLSADKTAGLVAAPVMLPRLGAPVVMMQQVDGKAEEPSGGLVSLSRQTELAAVRAALTERQLTLPLLVAGLQGESSGDERLDALYLARTIIEALSQGATGVLLEAHGESANSLTVGTVRPASGQLTPAAAVVRELALELSGAAPLLASVTSPEVRNSPEALVTYKPFLRGGEGVVALWNNTGISREISLEFLAQPVTAQVVRFSYQGDFVTRRWEPIYQFSEEAYKRNMPLHLLRVDPLEVVVLSFRLADPHAAWLKGIYPTRPVEAKPKTPTPPTREPRTWWHDLLRGTGRMPD
jgi:hypothetical protein